MVGMYFQESSVFCEGNVWWDGKIAKRAHHLLCPKVLQILRSS